MKPVNALDSYLAGESHEVRMRLLSGFVSTGVGLPSAIVVALLRLELPAAEKISLLEAISMGDPTTFEDFVFDHMIHWPQDVAAKALRLWAGTPSCSRWNELVTLAGLPGIPQRILYTILEVSVRAPDDSLARACVDVAMRAEGDAWSPAFKALMFVRMLQRRIQDERVDALARMICEKSVHEFVPEDKSAFAAWIYLWSFHNKEFKSLQARISSGSPQSLLLLLPVDGNLEWLNGRLPGLASKAPLVERAKGVRGSSDDDGAGACLSWLLTKDGPPEHIKKIVSGVWQQFVVIGDPAASDDSWTAATNAMRAKTGIYRIICIRALGKRHQSDLAVLKLLDFVRSDDVRELTEVARALGSIGSPRAVQELISMVSRDNAATDLQIEIAGILKTQKLDGHRDAIAAAVAHMAGRIKASRGNGGSSEPLVEVWEALTGLAGSPASVAVPAIDAKVMDDALAKSIPHYEQLSAEVKRALRTAWYFHRQIENGSAAASIDLSPVIDMQYKAMELLFREYFESACLRLVQQGTIQRKLDLIGYARPIQEKMDEFENYIAAMPVIKAIPFFSKFKMRKLLLALCQFKPGRRFTLDGLKAFGLFFFIFGRNECRFGLTGILPVVPAAFKDQSVLAEFCRLLHVFQDFRNRAAHEGFHPDAAADINGIWRNTAEIVQFAHAMKRVLSQSQVEPGLVRGRAS